MFLLVIIILGLLSLAFWSKIERRDLENLAGCVIVVSVVLAMVAMISYPMSFDRIAETEAFYNKNKYVYARSVKEFPNSGKAITRDDSTTVITLPYDMVKSIIEYNTYLTWYRKYQRHWFIGGFVGRISNNLDYIVPIY